MREILIAGVAVMCFALPANAEIRNLSGFTGIAAKDRLEVTITQGPAFRVEVNGADAARVRTEIRDGSLHIFDGGRGWFSPNRDLDARVLVTMPEIEEIAAARGVSVRASDIQARDIDIAVSMGSELSITGTCQHIDAAASMGASLDADGFQCQTADVAASMGGDAQVFAQSRYDAAASMGGSINIEGSAVGDAATSMGGSVSH